jgi:phosphocarrier protein
MMLAAAQGAEIEISCDGKDEEAAMNTLEALINNRFDEDE